MDEHDQNVDKQGKNKSKSCCKEVCYQHDMKLKDAEKTIANKEVIIQMLQDQVKKLEESYKQNLRQTEGYRYKFCIAAEQIKKLRACKKDKCSEKQDKEKDIENAKGSKSSLEQQLAPDQTCPSPVPCYFLQQIYNIEKIMKAQYELLQILLEKVSGKPTDVQPDSNITENSEQVFSEETRKTDTRREQEDEISRLQQEIKSLKQENVKLHEQIEETYKSNIPKVTDSLLGTYRKTNEDLQKKFSYLLQKTSVIMGVNKDDIMDDEMDDDSEFYRRVSFASPRTDIQITKPYNDEDNSKSRNDNTSEFKVIKLPGSRQGSESNIAQEPYVKKSESNIIEAENSKPVKTTKVSIVTRIPETVSSESDQKQDVNEITAEDPSKQTENEGNGKLHGEIRIKSDRPPQQVQVNVICVETIANTTSLLKTIADVTSMTENVTLIEVTSENVTRFTTQPAEITEQTKNSQNNQITEVPKNESKEQFQDNKIIPNTDNSKRPEQTESNSFLDALCYCTPAMKEEICENNETQVNTLNSANSENAISSEQVQELDEAVITKESSEAMEEKNETVEQNITTIVKSMDNKDFSDVAEKLNNIADKVTELLDKQTDTCREIELLKGEMTMTHNTTKACTDNISKLKETIDQQKDTFLANFREHKEITDNLKQVTDTIQEELTQLKSKIETLFKNTDDPAVHKMYSEDLITLEECKFAISKICKNTDTSKSVGIPTQCETTPDDKISNNLRRIEEQSSTLKKENEETESKIHDLSALISQCKNRIAFSEKEMVTDETKQRYDDNEINKCIEKVKSESLILKTTLSSVINHLNAKMNELKYVMNQKEHKTSSCICNRSKTELPSHERDLTAGPSSSAAEPELEIEDIYNAVRRSYAPKQRCNFSATSCLCSLNPVTSYMCYCNESENDAKFEDTYDSVFCTCGSQRSDRNDGEIHCGNTNTCSQHSLIENLETYVSYLYEQLNIISTIESRIEDVRCHIKNP